MESITVLVFGQVQGVGFRWATRQKLADLGLEGVAENLLDGSVRVTATGEAGSVEALLEWLGGPTAPGRVRAVRVE